MSIRRLRFGLSTLLGFGKRGFFIPYRYAGQVPARLERGAYDALEPVFADAAGTFAALLNSLAPYDGEFRSFGGEPAGAALRAGLVPPASMQRRFTSSCARHSQRRIVEVGSGHSTRFMARAIRDGGLSTELVSIDPAPRAAIDGTGTTLIRSTVQRAGLAPFSPLASGDILFIDSSHILMPGTDVDFLFNRVLPGLTRGVLVHVHDIFLPDDYPPEWEWRGYNEQLGVAALLQGRGFRLLWSSHYATTRMKDAVEASVARDIPLMPGAHEASVWVVKV